MIDRLLFYDDSEVFGGHQVSAVTAAAYAASAGVHVTFAHRDDNDRLAARLAAAAPGVQTLALRIPRLRLQAVAAAAGLGLRPARDAIRGCRPAVVVAVQGNILLSTRGIEAARRARVPAVSFIPMALKGSGASVRNHLWRAVARFHYSRPDLFITTSDSARRDLQAAGVRAPVRVAYYGPDLARQPRHDRSAARAQLGVGEGGLVIAIVGRVVFAHKGHDVLLNALATCGAALGPFHLIVAGDGPDQARLRDLSCRLGLERSVTVLPWLDDLSLVYSAADMVALPSRFEGLPLVALEAMHYRLKVIASDVDGVAEVVPPEWRVPAGDPAALAEAIITWSRADVPALLERNDALLRTTMNSVAFSEAFLGAVSGVLPR